MIDKFENNNNTTAYLWKFDLFKHLHSFLEFEWKNKLRYVRIYFDTPIFDKIKKDTAVKFVDILSAIGGTMGLLTGFSIISVIEIIYFSLKILRSCINIRNWIGVSNMLSYLFSNLWVLSTKFIETWKWVCFVLIYVTFKLHFYIIDHWRNSNIV